MAIKGLTLILLDDNTFDTIENIYSKKTFEFNTYALDSDNKIVSAKVTNLRPEGYSDTPLFGAVLNKYGLYGNLSQSILMADGYFKLIKYITPIDYIKAKYLYLANKTTDDATDVQCRIDHTSLENSSEMLYSFTQNEYHNILLPYNFGNNRTAIKDNLQYTSNNNIDVFLLCIGDDFISLNKKYVNSNSNEFIFDSKPKLE